jgi:hypothetical protein
VVLLSNVTECSPFGVKASDEFRGRVGWLLAPRLEELLSCRGREPFRVARVDHALCRSLYQPRNAINDGVPLHAGAVAVAEHGLLRILVSSQDGEWTATARAAQPVKKGHPERLGVVHCGPEPSVPSPRSPNKSSDRREDLVGGLGPDERLRLFVREG